MELHKIQFKEIICNKNLKTKSKNGADKNISIPIGSINNDTVITLCHHIAFKLHLCRAYILSDDITKVQMYFKSTK